MQWRGEKSEQKVTKETQKLSRTVDIMKGLGRPKIEFKEAGNQHGRDKNPRDRRNTDR